MGQWWSPMPNGGFGMGGLGRVLRALGRVPARFKAKGCDGRSGVACAVDTRLRVIDHLDHLFVPLDQLLKRCPTRRSVPQRRASPGMCYG
jgi:hypothetical protein